MIATRSLSHQIHDSDHADPHITTKTDKKSGQSTIHRQNYNIHFPQREQNQVSQDDERVELTDNNGTVTIRFHNYAEIYNRPGLYELLFDDILKCSSPYVIVDMLKKNQHLISDDELRVFDFGAGNGMIGRELRKNGADYIIGCDILPEARKAALRDCPGVYDNYLAEDITKLCENSVDMLKRANFNALTIGSALGFGDIPRTALVSAVRFVKKGGLVVFNLKDVFYKEDSQSEFSSLIRENVERGAIQIVAQQRYQHRLSVTGEQLFYYAFVAIKHDEVS